MRKLVLAAFLIVAVMGLSDPAEAVTTEVWSFDKPDGSASPARWVTWGRNAVT